MADIIKLIRVFLASPGDLQEERRLANEAIDELNKGIAPHLGYRVELKGWEDTLPGSGRPQAIINRELDICELFIGIMWKRWGTPSDAEGSYSSGFEEEFERSTKRFRKTGQPEMAMYFKNIPSEFLVDPGKDLQKVLEFHDRIISEKQILFETFSDQNEFQQCIRLKVSDYLIKLSQITLDSIEAEQTKSKIPEKDQNTSQDISCVKSPFSVEGHVFLKELLEKTQVEDDTKNITPLDVARFRLLSNTINKSGNNDPYLGVHDANILFENRQILFGSQEVSKLIDCGLKNIDHENTPLWYWYNIKKKNGGDGFLTFRSLAFSEEDLSVGALKAMKLIGVTPNFQGHEVTRELIIKTWLADDNSDAIKIAALDYLKHHGMEEDLSLIQSELDKANSTTSKIALEAILGIQIKGNKEEAFKTAIKNHFESIDQEILTKILTVSMNVNDELLLLGLKHRNEKIRLESFKKLKEKNGIDTNTIKELKNDPYSLVRKEVVDYLLSTSPLIEDEEVKSILKKPKKNKVLGGLLIPQPDQEGSDLYEEYQFSKYYKMSENELLRLIEKSSVFNKIPYFVLCSKYFKKHSTELIKKIKDRFSTHFENYIEQIKKSGLPKDSIKETQNLGDFFKKISTRKSLNILCKKSRAQDLNLIRENLHSDYIESSLVEIEYMRKFGEWDDIATIVKKKEDYITRQSIMGYSNDNYWHQSVANAIYHIGRNRFNDLVQIEMPHQILSELFKICSLANFSKLPDPLLMSFLNKKESDLRKVVSLKSVLCFKKSKLKRTLEEYIENHEYRYYNVIFWLDFGISMPTSVTKKAIRFVISQ